MILPGSALGLTLIAIGSSGWMIAGSIIFLCAFALILLAKQSEHAAVAVVASALLDGRVKSRVLVGLEEAVESAASAKLAAAASPSSSRPGH